MKPEGMLFGMLFFLIGQCKKEDFGIMGEVSSRHVSNGPGISPPPGWAIKKLVSRKKDNHTDHFAESPVRQQLFRKVG
jgi:hypothetical protein